ncbi:MAG: phosphatidate cytidylyltransferase [Solirubrobacteraceae bacterium]|jgi:phosphatidate cytidylyltransferase|nr:phosphatidate cytidylyltransferase [Solirubrobacteraceae bacterium]
MAETPKRILQAIPAIGFAAFIMVEGGIIWSLGLIVLGVLCMRELYEMMRRSRPVDIAGYLALAALCLTALYGEKRQILLVLVLTLPLTFLLAAVRPRRSSVSWGIAATLFGVFWIGLALAHAVFLRELPHGGALVVDTLIGTFIGDTCAYFGGRAWGRTRIAPRISPNKTLAGLVSGIVGGTFAFWLFGLAYQHEWFGGTDRVLIGLAVAVAAPVGDLFESMIKRDLGVKDTGRVFGAHGGALDRLDAALFTVVAAYYVSVAVLQ